MPSDNGQAAWAATVFNVLICPSDVMPPGNQFHYPVVSSPWAPQGQWWGLCSYGLNQGNGVPNINAQNGVLYTTTGTMPKLTDITDGTSSTIMFGERTFFDNPANMAQLSADFTYGVNLANYGLYYYGGFWNQMLAQQALVQINYRVPNLTSPQPFSVAQTISVNRIYAYGSLHDGGANLAFADAHVQFVSNSLDLMTLQNLSTRAGGEVITVDY
jgi:prepilin-type processing-associated H-X9-DG protein